MKKIAVFVAILAFVPAISFAQTLGSTTDHTLEVETSNQVTLNYNSTSGSGDTFAIATAHAKGTRSYMSSSEDSIIYWGPGVTATAPAAPTVGTSVGPTTAYPNAL